MDLPGIISDRTSGRILRIFFPFTCSIRVKIFSSCDWHWLPRFPPTMVSMGLRMNGTTTFPMQGKEEYFNSEKYEIKHHDWKKTNRMTDIITMINAARKNNKALQSTWNVQFCTIENPNLLAYFKATDDLSNIILVVVNLDSHGRQSGYVQLPLGRLKITGRS